MSKRQALRPALEALGETPENQRFWTPNTAGIQKATFYKRATLPQ